MSGNWPFGDLQPLSYDLIVCDPPSDRWSRSRRSLPGAAASPCLAQSRKPYNSKRRDMGAAG